MDIELESFKNKNKFFKTTDLKFNKFKIETAESTSK